MLESVEGLTLHSAEYVSPSGSSYIETPEFIAHKKSIVNVRNEDENCFKYAVTAAQFYPWIDQNNADRPSTYKDFLDKLDYTNCSTPMQIDDITKFEKNNDLAINVYHIMHQGKIITPLRITENDVPLDNYINLLIEGKETCHYTWIMN